MANAPFSPGFLPADNPISQWVAPRRNALLGFGAGMLSPGLSGAATGAMQGMALDRQYAADAAKQADGNRTMEWVQANYPQYATLPVEQAIDLSFRAEAAKKSGAGSQESFFGTAVPMQDAEGNIVLGQMSNQGNWQPLQGADGYSPAPTTKTIDTGTEIITQDIYGNELFRTPKNNREAAYDTGYGGVEGKSDAESDTLFESVQSKMPGLRTVVDQLKALSDTATYTQSGQAMDAVKRELGLEVGQGAIDRASYIAIVDAQVLPLLRDTFGAAFTEKEGAALRATLGDPNKSPPEKAAILDAFIAQKERDVEAMRSRKAGGAAAPVVRTFNPATGRLE